VTIVGIDLGTTHSVVAAVVDGVPRVLQDANGDALVPSVVHFPEQGPPVVGRAAVAARQRDPANTFFSTKRLLGLPFTAPEVSAARAKFPFDVTDGPSNTVLARARGKFYTLPEISASILAYVKNLAGRALGETVTQAVITVPAHFNELQRASTKVAARVAGLEVVRMLNEPTAAALAYGLGLERRQRVVVYDLGGGTFDCTVLDLDGSVFEVLATGGDSYLGGDDIDALIVDRMVARLYEQEWVDVRTRTDLMEKLRAGAEALKKTLSTEEAASVTLDGVIAQKPFLFQFSRAELEALAVPLVDRTLRVTETALREAQLSATSVDHVILVGGSSRLPLVRARVAAFFGKRPLAEIDPDIVVAVGAAIQASLLADPSRAAPIPPPPRPFTVQASPKRSPAQAALEQEDEPTNFDKKNPIYGSPNRPSTPPQHGSLPPGPFGAVDEPPELAAPRRSSMPPPLPLPLRPSHAATAPPPQAFAFPAPAPVPQFGAPPSVAPASTPTLPSQASPAFGADLRATSNALFSPFNSPQAPVRPGSVPVRAPDGRELNGPDRTQPLPAQAALRSPDRTQKLPSQPPPPPGQSWAPGSGPTPAYIGQAPMTPNAAGNLRDLYLPAVAPNQPQAPFERAQPPVFPGDLAFPPPRPQASPGTNESFAPGSGPTPAFIAPAPARVPNADWTSPISTQSLAALAPGAAQPVLVDVTPRALVVETVGGFVDLVVPRNARIPCERKRSFTTATDGQTVVRIRIAQGEGATFSGNTVLGEVLLEGIRPAIRGEVQINVTFEVDQDGTLRVRATEEGSGREARVSLRLQGIADDDEIEEMSRKLQAPNIGRSVPPPF
jgi:molecular chaperone DnaK